MVKKGGQLGRVNLKGRCQAHLNFILCYTFVYFAISTKTAFYVIKLPFLVSLGSPKLK